MGYKIEPQVNVCPYLGLSFDPKTALSFASVDNCCFHGRMYKVIKLDHQEEFCLNGKFQDCSEYASAPDAPLPELKDIPTIKIPRSRTRGKKMVLGLFISAILILLSWILISKWLEATNETATPAGTVWSTRTFILTTSTSTNILDSPTSPALDTVIPYLALGIETPLGLGRHFVIHRIQAGESLEFIARQYGTTVESLLEINYQLPSPLLPGIVIVVPVSFTDTQDLPSFIPFEVLSDTLLSDLADQLLVDLEELQYYNGFEGEVLLRAGDWVLFPQGDSSLP
jgi:LysM repeat protein